jgi:hypothetical protein
MIWASLKGAPLSPILFALYVKGLLEALNDATLDSQVEHFPFAFSDDHNVVVISDSFERNGRAFEVLHDVIMKWARRVRCPVRDEKVSDNCISVVAARANGTRAPAMTPTTNRCIMLPRIQGLTDARCRRESPC